MKNSTLTSRTSLLKKSRKHFAAFAATSILMTGALASVVANEQSSDAPGGTGTNSGSNKADDDSGPSGDSNRSGVVESEGSDDSESDDSESDDSGSDDSESDDSGSSTSTGSQNSTSSSSSTGSADGSSNAS